LVAVNFDQLAPPSGERLIPPALPAQTTEGLSTYTEKIRKLLLSRGSTTYPLSESFGEMLLSESDGSTVRFHVAPLSVDFRSPLDQLATQTALSVTSTRNVTFCSGTVMGRK
jgi:hypothetical protein